MNRFGCQVTYRNQDRIPGKHFKLTTGKDSRCNESEAILLFENH